MDNKSKCIENIYRIMEELKKDFHELSGLISKYDLAEQDILHHIENDELSQEESIAMIRLMKSIRQSRRTTKNQFEAINLLKAAFIDNCRWDKLKKTVDKVLEEQERRDYTYRVLTFIPNAVNSSLKPPADFDRDHQQAS